MNDWTFWDYMITNAVIFIAVYVPAVLYWRSEPPRRPEQKGLYFRLM